MRADSKSWGTSWSRPFWAGLTAAALVVTSAGGAGAQRALSAEAPAVPREFRGVWVASVANIDWPSKPGLSSWQQQSELIALLDRARALRLNAVLLQVRPAGDALYDSPFEPWSSYLTGVEGRAPEPYYDPLAFAVREAHARGLELHAWLNPYRARHPTMKGPNATTHMANTKPAWVKRYGNYLWMDPGEPGVLAHSVKVALDVVTRYDVDGIHVDDYFYPYPEADSSKTEVPFPDSGSYARYRARGGQLGLSDWRRHNVDRYVQQVYQRTKAIKPWVKVGISPFGIWRPGYPESVQGFDAYEKLAGDSRKWLHEGWVDYFTPQLYWPIARPAQSYPVLLDWWIGENRKGRHIWPGHNSSRAGNGGPEWAPEELNNQVRLTRATTARGQGATGDVFFSMKSLVPAALADRLTAELYQDDALVPASPWLGAARPAAPVARLRRVPSSREIVLRVTPGRHARWIAVRMLHDGVWTHRVLPSTFTQLVVSDSSRRAPSRVLVSAVDRVGRESAPVILTGVR